MSIPAITPLTDLPSIADPANFDPRADNFITVQLPNLVAQINAVGSAMADALVEALNAATVALAGTSASSVSIGTGSKSFTTQANKSWVVGNALIIASAANPTTHWMMGTITSYSGTTLVMNISHVGSGTGSRSDWSIGLSAKPEGLAQLASPAFSGTPTAPTAAASTNTTQIATTAFVQAAITALKGGVGTALDTLVELSAALGNDANFAATVTNALAAKLANIGGSFTGGYNGGTPAGMTGTTLSPNLSAISANGHARTYTNNGNFTLSGANLPSGSYDLDITVTNAASGAGNIDVAGFNFADTANFSNSANAVFILHIKVRGSRKSLYVYKNS